MTLPLKKILFPLLGLTLLFFCAVQAAQAAEGGRTIGSAELERVFTETLLDENSPWQGREIQVAKFTARPASLSLPAGKIGWQVVQKPADGKLGRKTLVVAVLLDGREYGQIRMSGDLKLFGEVIRTTRRLSRNDIISAEDIIVSRQDISMLDGDRCSSPDRVVGQKLKTSLPAGSILFGQFIDAPPLVQRGEIVTIIAQSGAIRITVPGEAKQTGALGEMIKVKNLTSRREIHARVAGSGLVETVF